MFLSDAEVLAILRKHGFPGKSIEVSDYEGAANHVRMAGEVCIRVLRDEAFAADVEREALIVPSVRRAGISAPELLVFDADRDIVPSLVTIYRRLPGEPLAASRQTLNLPKIYSALGEQIALWTHKVTHIEDPLGLIPNIRLGDVGGSYERNAERMSDAERKWATAMSRRLETVPPGPRLFAHNDLHGHNILIDEAEFVATLDWGAAGWGEAAVNFHCLPAAWLPTLLAPLKPARDLIARCLYGALGYALNDIHRPADPSTPNRNHGHRRWESLSSLYRQNLPEVWRDCLGDPPPLSA